MGLDGADLVDDGHGFGASDGVDGGGKEGKLSAVVVVVSCSICLDAVTDDGVRSWAKLQCGHQFHLDCIGSAFNIKGAMQCPNCRKIEKGQWLYATGCRALPELTMDDISTEEDIYDLSYSEMSFGVHWCPFSGIARLPSLFDEGDFSSTTYHDFLGQRTIFAEHTAAASTTAHPCPYIAYLGPVHPSSSTSNATISDVSNFNGHWNGASSVSNDIPTSYAFPGVEVHMNAWDHHSQLFPTSNAHIGGGGEQTSVPSVSQRARVTTSDIPRQGSFMQQPFVVRHGSSARSGSSVPTTMVPPYPGSVARARDRVQALQAYFQQPSNSPSAVRTPVISGSRRSSSHHPPPTSDQTNGFYFFPSSSSSGRAFQEAENPLSNRFPHSWDNREHFPSYQSGQLDRDSSSGWGLFHHPGAGSEAAAAAGVRFRQRHGSERMPSQNRP